MNIWELNGMKGKGKVLRDKGKKREVWVDLVRVVAILMVVVIHVSAGVSNSWGQVPLESWLVGVSFNAASRVSIGMFFMLSGALLLPKRDGWRKLFFYRVPRILKPWLFWAVMIMLWRLVVDGARPDSVIKFVYEHVWGNWFMPVILILYLLLPVWRAISRDKGVSGYVLLMWFGVFVVMPFVARFSAFGRQLMWPGWVQYGGYFLLGDLISNKLQVTRNKISLYGLFGFLVWVMSTVAIVAGAYRMSGFLGKFDIFLIDYLSLPVVLGAVGLFVGIKSWDSGLGIRGWGWLEALSKTAFGVFLVHIFVLGRVRDAIPGQAFWGSWWDTLIYVVGMVLLVGGISWGLVFAVSRLPGMRKWVS